MEQDNKKNIIWIDFDTNTEKCLASIQDALKKKPELVYVKMSSMWFPRRVLDLPIELLDYVMGNPMVKFVWDGNSPLDKKEDYEIVEVNEESIDNDTKNQDEHSFLQEGEMGYGYNVSYEYIKPSRKKNKINVLVINFGDTFNYTLSVISDLMMQTTDFDLTIVDNNGDCFERNEIYFRMLYEHWNFTNRSLHIIGICESVPLNHLWNSFYQTTTNEWLCFLNNDVGIPVNFISDNEKVIELEPTAGIISHATNKPNVKVSNNLLYSVYERGKKDFLHRQGWDFTINRKYFTEIPSELTTFVGDGIIFYGVYKYNADAIFVYSSPIIHYCSSSQKGKENYFGSLMKKESFMYYKNSCYSEYGNMYKYAVDDDLSELRPIDVEQLKRNIYFDDSKRIIVSLTTWKGRINTLPIVLDSIVNQTLKPWKIIVNLSKQEFLRMKDIPKNVLTYIRKHKIEINWVKDDTKVYKKIIPTLLNHKNDLVLSIDDDFIYPRNMIVDFYKKYMEYPNNPISGNRITKFGMDCHCGCSSLVQYKFYNVFIEDCMRYYENCKSSDIVYTYIANVNGYHYVHTDGIYFNNMQNIPSKTAYSLNNGKYSDQIVQNTYDWMQKNLFGGNKT